MKKIELLFVSPLVGNSHELYKALQRNNNVNISTLLTENKKKNDTIFCKILNKLKLPVDSYRINKKLQKYALASFDIIFIVKGNEIYPNTLRKIQLENPQLKLINWSLDDMYLWHNRSHYYTYSIKYYDLVVTTKSSNINELPQLGAKKILFTYQAYSSDIHKPQKCSGRYNHNIVFIGYPEKSRIESMLFLANHGLQIDIYGDPNAWRKPKYNIEHANITIHHEALLEQDYAEALSCSKISLCFLRKLNRDLHTSRSIEIPACTGFMLAERTDEHKKLFEDGKEAVFFSTQKELLAQVNYYLEHDNERKKIAQAGYDRTRRDDYSYDSMINKIFEFINES